MARAKRTARADARRRHRAQFADTEALEGEVLDETDDRPASRPGARPASAATSPGSTATPQGSGIAFAFRHAYRRANLREDLAHLPEILRQRSLWLTSLLMIGVAGVFAAYGGRDVITQFLLPYFVAPPPVGAIFIAGFFAKRASYIAGALVGLVGAVIYSALLLGMASGALPQLAIPIVPSSSAAPSVSAPPSASVAPSATLAASPGASPEASAGVSPTPSRQPITQEELDEFVAENLNAAFIISPISGIFFAAAVAWYRRFLNLASPARNRRPPPPQRGKPARR